VAQRLRLVVPVTLAIIFLLLYLNFRGVTESVIVMLSVPFALVGGVWYLWLAGYDTSVAVWVGFIALAGVAAETGVVMLIYLDEAFHLRALRGTMRGPEDVAEAVFEGAVGRLRPKMMTVVAIIAGLAPILWSRGTGADVMKRIACGVPGKSAKGHGRVLRDRPMASRSLSLDALRRAALLRMGVSLETFTIGYNVLEGLVAIVAGLLAGSVALTGFGVDSVIEVTSGVLLWWRLRAELGSAPLGPAVERRAARWAGLLLLALALYIVADSARHLIQAQRPEVSRVGIGLTGLSLLVMPLLARAKLRAAVALDSRALRADAHETIVCAWLSLTTLVGLALNALLGWWWADPLAALLMLPLIVREGLEAWSGE
jgi:hypothetical protein